MGIINVLDIRGKTIGKLGIWEMNETVNALKEQFCFSENEQKEFNTFSNERRKCEFLSIRLLLQEMLQRKTEIFYNDSGKPFLKNQLNVSISHSSGLAVLLLSEKPVGIDVESLHRNIEKVAPRFLSEKEINQVQNSPDPAFTQTLYWCAKEALFKCTPQAGIHFKSQILINPFLPSPEAGKFTGHLLINKRVVNFVFHYFVVNQNAIVYCMEQEYSDQD